jgi:hypothetical protein
MAFIDSDEDETNSLIPTKLDLERLNDLETNSFLDGELSTWRILRYSNSYCLIIKVKNWKGKNFFEFANLDILLNYLNK